jgi:BlaI family penicillinase repressor
MTRLGMAATRVTRFELQLLEKMWQLGPCSVREIQESLSEKNRPAYTTVQTIVYRMEEKGSVQRTRKIGNAHVFEAVFTRKAVYRRLVGDLLDLFGGSTEPVMSHLIETGKLTLADVRTIERKLSLKEGK